jgi:hypothetical protein
VFCYRLPQSLILNDAGEAVYLAAFSQGGVQAYRGIFFVDALGRHWLVAHTGQDFIDTFRFARTDADSALGDRSGSPSVLPSGGVLRLDLNDVAPEAGGPRVRSIPRLRGRRRLRACPPATPPPWGRRAPSE